MLNFASPIRKTLYIYNLVHTNDITPSRKYVSVGTSNTLFNFDLCLRNLVHLADLKSSVENSILLISFS